MEGEGGFLKSTAHYMIYVVKREKCLGWNLAVKKDMVTRDMCKK